MQSSPTPPSIGQTVRKVAPWAILLILFQISLPILRYFPYLIYLACFYFNDLIPYVTNYYGAFLGNVGYLLFGGITIAAIVWSIVSGYIVQRKKWRQSQVAMLNGAGEAGSDESVPLPAPAAPPLLSVAIVERRRLPTVLLMEALWIWLCAMAYLGWSQSLFWWPPSQKLDDSIIGTVVALFLLASIITVWRMQPRHILVDQVGITVRQRGRKRMIVWSDVRQLVLIPMRVRDNVASPVEYYQIVTTTEPLDLLVPQGNTNGDTEMRQSIREAITLAMQVTKLSLLIDEADLQKRDIALETQEGKQIAKYIFFLCAALLCLSLGSGFLFSFHPNATYHTASGRLAHYSLANDEVSIQLVGYDTTFALSTLGVWPYPPATLPAGTPLTMQITGSDVGTLDVNTPTIQWHIVTQSYAEPWYGWLELGVIESVTGALGILLLALSAIGLWQMSHGKAQTPLDIHPPHLSVTAETVDASWSSVLPMTKQQLRRYARRQGMWWGIEPNNARDLGFSLIGLASAIGLLAGLLIFLTLISTFLPSMLLSIALDGLVIDIVLILLIAGIRFLRRWRELQTMNAQPAEQVTGTIHAWSPYVSLMGSWLETLIQIRTDGDDEYCFRISPQYLAITRHSGARVQIAYIAETAFVTSVSKAPKTTPSTAEAEIQPHT